MAIKVIDVSYAQGRMDWDAVAPHIGGAIIQLGYGSDYANQDDAQWVRNVAECKRLGIPFGAYLYSYAKTDDQARSEVAHALRLLPPASELSFPVYLDVEESSLGWFFRRAIEIWVSALREAGYTAGWYSGRALANQHGLASAPGESWVAEYGASRCAFSGRLDAWQYTSTEYVGGVGPLDVSWFYRDYRGNAKGKEDDMSLKEELLADPEGGNINAGQAVAWGHHYAKQTLRIVKEQQKQIDELKKLAGGGLKVDGGAVSIDYERLAKAVNDDAAKRLAE